jgi:hypothetical protein
MLAARYWQWSSRNSWTVLLAILATAQTPDLFRRITTALLADLPLGAGGFLKGDSAT